MGNALVITDKFAPHAGGTARCWTEWVACWEPGRVTVVTGGKSSSSALPRFDYRVRRVPYFDIPKLRMPLLWLALLFGALWEFRLRRPQVVYCGQVLETGWIGLLMQWLFRVPYVVVLYGEELPIHAGRPWSRRLVNLILSKAVGVGAITQFTVDLARRHTSFRGPIQLVYPGVDLGKFFPLPDVVRASSPVLLTLGRLMRRKGHDLVLESLPRLRLEFPGISYRILGVGPEMEALKALAQSLGIADCVHFMGCVDEPTALTNLNECSLFVHPNRQLKNGDVEGFGIVFLEANACGLPVIGGRSGGAVEAVADGRSGFLVDPLSLDDFIDKVRLLLTERSLWESMSIYSKQWASEFTWRRSALALWKLGTSAGGT